MGKFTTEDVTTNMSKFTWDVTTEDVTTNMSKFTWGVTTEDVNTNMSKFTWGVTTEDVTTNRVVTVTVYYGESGTETKVDIYDFFCKVCSCTKPEDMIYIPDEELAILLTTACTEPEVFEVDTQTDEIIEMEETEVSTRRSTRQEQEKKIIYTNTTLK